MFNVCSKYQFVNEFISIDGNKVAAGRVELWDGITQLFCERGAAGEIHFFSSSRGDCVVVGISP